MSATINLEKEKHFPVLLDELVSIISPHYGGTFIDCTFGQGSYSKKIFKFCKKSERKLIKIKNGQHSLSRKNDLKKICSKLNHIIKSISFD